MTGGVAHDLPQCDASAFARALDRLRPELNGKI